MNISVIIFCYNEAGNLPRVFAEVSAFLTTAGYRHEIIIVNDGSTDNTTQICHQIEAANPSVKTITHAKNLGIGRALKSGYDAACGEYVCALPGDGQFNVSELKLVAPFGNNTYYSFYRPQTDYTLYRKCLTWGNRLFNQHVLGVFLRDVNWIKVYRKEQLQAVQPELFSSLIESEICAKLYKCGVLPIEIPSVYSPRQFGISKGGSWPTLRKAVVELPVLLFTVIKFKKKSLF